MAVKEETSKVIYTLNATAERFPIPFDTERDDYGDAKNIDVYLGTVMLERGKDFLIESNTVIYKDAVNHGGEQLTVLRNTPVKQDIDFVDNGSFSLEDIEKMGDNIVRILQETKTNVGDTINAQFSADRALESEKAALSGATESARYSEQAREESEKASSSADRVADLVRKAETEADRAEESRTIAEEIAGAVAENASQASISAVSASDSAIISRTKAEESASSATSASSSASMASVLASSASASAGNALSSAERAEEGARRAEYIADLLGEHITGGIRYKGIWNADGQTDYSSLVPPLSAGYMYRVSGSAEIDGVSLNDGDYILINQDIPEGGAVFPSMVDHFDNTEPEYGRVEFSGEYEDGTSFSFSVLTGGV